MDCLDEELARVTEMERVGTVKEQTIGANTLLSNPKLESGHARETKRVFPNMVRKLIHNQETTNLTAELRDLFSMMFPEKLHDTITRRGTELEDKSLVVAELNGFAESDLCAQIDDVHQVCVKLFIDAKSQTGKDSRK